MLKCAEIYTTKKIGARRRHETLLAFTHEQWHSLCDFKEVVAQCRVIWTGLVNLMYKNERGTYASSQELQILLIAYSASTTTTRATNSRCTTTIQPLCAWKLRERESRN